MSDQFHVVFAADENYAPGLAVSVRAVIDHLSRDVPITVLDGGFSARTRDMLIDSWPPSTQVRFVAIDPARFSDLPLPPSTAANSYLSRAMYWRLLVPEVVPDSASRALYLDADTLAVDDISELFEVDLEGYALGAVVDPYVRVVSSTLGLPESARTDLPRSWPYFNSGVMLYDLRRWRSSGFSSQVIAFVRENPSLVLPDQHALNAVLSHHWKALENCWNVPIFHDHLARPRTVHDSHASMQVPPKGSRILHFVFSAKPWGPAFTHRGYLDIYQQYQNRTRWRL